MSETSVRAYDIKTEMAMRCFILSVEVINTLMNLRVVMVRWPFVARTSFVVHGGYPARAVQAKSSTIPVVMVEVSDAVDRGIVTNLAHAGGNITGLTSITPELAGKRLELLKEMIPGLKHVAVMWTPNAPTSAYAWKQIHAPARRLGLKLHSLKLSRARNLNKAFKEAVSSGVKAIISTSGIGSTFGQKRIVNLVAGTGLPTIFTDETIVTLGGSRAVAGNRRV